MRGWLLTILGGLGGAILGVLVWLVSAIAISSVVAYFYPGSSSDLMGDLPSAEGLIVFFIVIIFLPFGAFLGIGVGMSWAESVEANWVLKSLQHGLITTFRDDGTRFAETTYHRGVAHGPYRDYTPNGGVACEGQYANGLKDGEWRYYNPDGSLRMIVHFSAGQEIHA